MSKDDPQIVVEHTTERLYSSAGLTHMAWWTDKPKEIGYGTDEHDARARLDINYPRVAS